MELEVYYFGRVNLTDKDLKKWAGVSERDKFEVEQHKKVACRYYDVEIPTIEQYKFVVKNWSKVRSDLRKRRKG